MGPFCNTNVSRHGNIVEAHTSHIIFTYVAPDYKTIFFAKWENHTHQYMLDPIPLSTTRSNPSMWRRSHSKQCHRRCWGTSIESSRLCTLCPKQVPESKYTLWYNALTLNTFDYAFHTSSTKPNLCTIYSCGYNMHSQLQHSLVKFLNIENHYSLSCEMLYF